MCGRYGRRADKQRIAEWFHTHNTDVFNDEYYEINSTRLAPSYNISPESIQPVVRLDHDTGERVLAFMKWGMVPYWSRRPRLPSAPSMPAPTSSIVVALGESHGNIAGA